MKSLHKTEKQKKNSDQLTRLMTPMIAGILVCTFCLVSMTWAWFTASVDTPTQTMQSATRSTSVMVYEVSQAEDGESNPVKTPVTPKVSQEASLAQDTQTTDEGESVVVADEAVVWELSSEKSYEVVLTGEGDATKGYCKVALSHTESGKEPVTKLYTTSVFEKDHTFKFTYNTGGFSGVDGVTETEWKEYVETTTPPTLTIASFWGEPAIESDKVSLMSLGSADEDEIMLLSDGDVLGLAPIPCPEAKAETKIQLEGFELQEGAKISAKEDYKVSLTLKEGYEMPGEVVVNISGKDYVVSTNGAKASEDAPYYDVQTGVLTVPSKLLSDGATVSVKATATPIPEEQPEEEEPAEEPAEEAVEETTQEIDDNNETDESQSDDTSSDNNIIADNPAKKEEDSEQGDDKPVRTPIGGGGNGDGDDNDDDNSDGSSDGDSSSSGNNDEEAEDEKADVKLNLSQLTINLEETQIPTNADLVLTLSAKEDMKLPGQIVITLVKTIRDEDIGDEDTGDEEITEDKTEYIINTDGKDNPEGFEFDVESGELTISSELLEGVREITISDTEESEADGEEDKATLTFEVKNLTFDFTDDEIVTDEDVVISFTAGEGYELPETVIITIDGVEYIIYTSDGDSDKNPEGITFDAATGTLTISKDLLSDAEAITITAEGVEKEDEESGDKEDTDADKKDESEDKDSTDDEDDAEDGEPTDKDPESGTDTPDSEDKSENEDGKDNEDDTDNEDGTDAPGGENTEVTTPETNPDENNGEKDEDESTEPDNDPDNEENTDNEQDGEGEDNKEEGDGETTEPAEPSAPAEPDEPIATPETPNRETSDTEKPASGGNDGDDNGETGSDDSGSAQSGTPGENTTPAMPGTVPSAPTQNTGSGSNGTGQTTGTSTSSDNKEASSEE